ncbi:putative alpha-L-arabinofuranosidase [Actinoplanes missouriensis 431]|uniref:RNA polymerase sigma factor n=1 Tax=Actinoplanes missouriensis (strain ATCC 14538 / DSM 43046 / CBS 188.64 / JCM 3121 / NBRC 102363 / NCIMB 12654 / NRRL B-3342 / UNCC 431) TaxID=512565 RepID=I0H6C9_ACTM4|nr:sigma-70 family RNA polymerase sigma factor [Actinoplanes missouriensis]BAL88566.1 putative alpha-L-arabinofuranosidase [Actinoplanes missouriensis 431]
MRASGLVRAAQAGDRGALDDLVSAHLPMVYAIVRQGLDDDTDVDDVVQDVMLRALRQLGTLRTPESFRSWLAAIAVRQVGTAQRRAQRSAGQTAPLDEATPLADAEFEGVTQLRVELSAQRRQARRAGLWLDPGDRELLSLWWLEVAGQLSRAELAGALGISVIHAGVRVQRMRAQLELGRALEGALDARPRCPGLEAELAGWDGVRSPRWRKRLGRHVRGCAVCGRAAGELVAVERLLPSVVLFPVPVGVAAAILAHGGGGGAAAGGSGVLAAGKVGVFGHLLPLAAAHPVVATVAAGALAAGAAAGAVALSRPQAGGTVAVPALATTPGRGAGATTGGGPSATPRAGASAASAGGASRAPASGVPSSAASPPAAGALLRTGSSSLEAANSPGRYATVAGDLGVLTAVGPGNTVTARQQATFEVVAGLADAECFSFRVAGGRYLRHASWRVRADRAEDTPLFRGDATFCPQAGEVAGSLRLEASNYPGWFLRHRGDELWVDQSDGTAAFRADGSFLPRAPLAG